MVGNEPKGAGGDDGELDVGSCGNELGFDDGPAPFVSQGFGGEDMVCSGGQVESLAMDLHFESGNEWPGCKLIDLLACVALFTKSF